MTAALVVSAVSVSQSQAAKAKQRSAANPENGKHLFASSCAACHGLDGKGSERAPNIAEGTRRMSHTQVFQIVQNGIPGTGMPAFHTLSAEQINSLVAHLRTLGGASKAAKLPGDPVAGKTLFTQKAGCFRCHMVAGEGGFIASNLSDYGHIHSPEEVLAAIVSPSASHGGPVRLATVTLRSGDKYTGRVRNEDNFSVQLQTLDGTFHFLSRSDVENLQYDSDPLMPANYGSTLSANELNDLVSFLVSTATESRHGEHKENPDCSPACDPD